MTFEKMAFARMLIRLGASDGLTKEALLQGALNMAGRLGKAAINNPGKAAVVGLGAMSVPSILRKGVDDSKARTRGFDPNVQAYAAQQQGVG